MTPDDPLGFCPSLLRLTRQGRATGRSGRELSTAPLSSVNNLIVLRHLMLERRPQRTLEVGLSLGGSALVFAATHRELGHVPQRQHITMDPFQASVWDDAGLVAVEREGLDGFVDFRAEPSALALPALLAARQQIELAYIDGSHLFEDVFIDAFYVLRLLAHGGVVVFDDCTDSHVAKVIKFLRTNSSAGVAEFDLQPYRADRGSVGYRVARHLGRVQMAAFTRVGDVDREWNTPLRRF